MNNTTAQVEYKFGINFFTRVAYCYTTTDRLEIIEVVKVDDGDYEAAVEKLKEKYF